MRHHTKKGETMSNLAFLGYAIQQADTARDALLRFTVATAVAFHDASVTGGNGRGDEVRAALKAALRDRGENRKTADRWVNDACRAAPSLIARFAPDYERASVADVVSDMLSRIKADASNTAQLFELLGVKKPGKETEPRGAELARQIADAPVDGPVSAPAPVDPTQGLRAALESLVAKFGLEAVSSVVITMTAESAAEPARKAA
jgi:hypothetical protein